MKILIIASTDSYNQALMSIAKKLKKSNHKVLILLTEQGEAHNQLLINNTIEYRYWNSFDEYDYFDIALYGNILNRNVLFKVLKSKMLKISLFFHLVIDEYILGGAHLNAEVTLCFGDRFIQNQIKNGVIHNLLPIGMPYDKKRDNSITTKKEILFLEQHFYPSGNKGKKELASFLIKLANKKKDYKIIVKPRSLENETGSKHKAKHIYSYIKEPPQNLILLKEHFSLDDLSTSAEIVMTTFSTAIAPAILLNKPIVFVHGFSMIETNYYNKVMVNKYYQIYKDSLNIMHYKDILNSTHKIEPMNQEFKNKLFYKRENNFDTSVVEFLEYIHLNWIKDFTYCNIDNYNIKSFDLKKSPYNELNNRVLERFYLVNIVTGFRLEKERKLLLKRLNELKKEHIDINKYVDIIDMLKQEYLQAGIKRVLQEYKIFPIGFKAYYLKYLYDNKKTEKFNKLSKPWKIADYYYYKYLNFKLVNKVEAKKNLLLYIKKIKKSSYYLTPLYDDNIINSAKNSLIEDYNGVY